MITGASANLTDTYWLINPTFYSCIANPYFAPIDEQGNYLYDYDVVWSNATDENWKEDTDYNRFKRWNEKIADDPVWEEAIVDRVKLMVERDKKDVYKRQVPFPFDNKSSETRRFFPLICFAGQ